MPWQQMWKSVITDDPFAFVFVFMLSFLTVESCLELLDEIMERKTIYSEVPPKTKHYLSHLSDL